MNAASRPKALSDARGFAVACLRNDRSAGSGQALDELLTCFRYKTLAERTQVRTTNAIERRFREVRRRTRGGGGTSANNSSNGSKRKKSAYFPIGFRMTETMVNVPPKVVLTDYTFPSIETERSLIEAAGAKFEAYQCQNREEISSAVDGANVVLVQLARIDQDAVSKLAPGATIVRYGIGYDNIDVEAARKFGIKVAYVPDYCTDEVADHTVALMLSLVRGLYVMNATVRSGGWMSEILKLNFSPLEEMTIGLIGLGRIARAVVDRTRAFSFRHLAYDPLVSASYAERVGVELDGLHSVISQSDILSLHVPLTQETSHLINAESLRWMKPSAVLVNTARGGLVDLEALSDALCNAKIAGAALDVFEEEPLPSNHPLRREAKVILTPHVAWYSTASIARLQRLVAEEAVRAVKGQALRCPIPDM